MGVFDSIFVDCPRCGLELEFQSKSGDCMLGKYTLWSAPPEVVVGTSLHVCSRCHSNWILVLPPVNAIIREVTKEEQDG